MFRNLSVTWRASTYIKSQAALVNSIRNTAFFIHTSAVAEQHNNKHKDDTATIFTNDSVSASKAESHLTQPERRDCTLKTNADEPLKDRNFADFEADQTKATDNPRKVLQNVASTFENRLPRMLESRVPSSRIERIWQYGGLATSMTVGAIGEGLRRVTGQNSSTSSLILTERNIERLVSRFSRLRGAALKIGQMISFQDSKSVPSPIREILQKVQDRADYMPAWQRNRVLTDELGSEWRNMFTSFDELPIAAASIGQVHRATLKSDGCEVAVKIQYPGVATSIESDLNNFAILLTASKLLPKGLYLNKTIDNARRELAWECDYIREATCMRRFAQLLEKDDAFVVPHVIGGASSRRVITSEMVHGIAVAKAQSLSQAEKDWIGTNIIRLCLRELVDFKFMQTDPNWTNFLYNKQSGKLELLDFGASRDFSDDFVSLYMQTLKAASRSDKNTIHTLSKQLGYLTEHDSARMVEAHIESVLALAEPFNEKAPRIYDFKEQTITQRIKELIPLMLRERLVPPPEETYSLHRKFSGAFLLCARLGSRVKCRDIFSNVLLGQE